MKKFIYASAMAITFLAADASLAQRVDLRSGDVAYYPARKR